MFGERAALIKHGGFNGSVPESDLQLAHVETVFHGIDRVCVAQGRGGDVPRKAGTLYASADDALGRAGGKRGKRPPAGEDPGGAV